eukprot:GHRQ01037795.1.p2 GENE.GHRQ01037795.1~~GHRQ01037795.1.p2  ORF type:complete len:102 (+),score=30.83 GHRQ01037795.1:425-730(+)
MIAAANKHLLPITPPCALAATSTRLDWPNRCCCCCYRLAHTLTGLSKDLLLPAAQPPPLTCRNRSAMVFTSTGGGLCMATILARLTAPLGLFIISCCSSCM